MERAHPPGSELDRAYQDGRKAYWGWLPIKVQEAYDNTENPQLLAAFDRGFQDEDGCWDSED